MPAFRLVSCWTRPSVAHLSRFVGREPRARADRQRPGSARRPTPLRTAHGGREAGCGKSRLVAQALTAIEARLVRGGRLPYGEGITYWPVVEAVKQLAARPSDPWRQQRSALSSGRREHRDERRRDRLGFPEAARGAGAAGVVFDDIHCGDETFLDLLERPHAALRGRAAPAAVHGAARVPPTADTTWGGFRRGPSRSTRAGRVAARATQSLDLRDRIARAAGGNPLFISEMVAMATEDGEVDVPPTLKALLTARLDQLDCPSAASSSEARSRARSSIAAPCRRSPRGTPGDGQAGRTRPP